MELIILPIVSVIALIIIWNVERRTSNKLKKTVQSLTEQIHESRRKEKSSLEQAVDVICSIGTDHRFISVNQAAIRAWGYAPDELKGRAFTELVLPDQVEKTVENFIGAGKSIDTLNFENQLVRKDGQIIDVLWSAHWSAVDQAVFCVAHDITARKKAEKLLQESEARIRELFEQMPVGLLVVNQRGYIETSNPAMNRICQDDQLEGTPVQKILPNLERDSGISTIDKTLSEKGYILTETNLTDSNGGNCAVQVSLRSTIFQGKQRYLYIVVDVSEREQIEQAKRQFVAMVSHELRSPLASLRGVMFLFESGALGSLNQKGMDIATRSKNEVDRLVQLINELLDVEKIRAGKFDLHLERTSARTLIESAVSAIQSLADKRSISINSEASDHACVADGGRLIQVLINLLSNAIKYSPTNSTILVRVSKEADRIIFSVRDNGRGIPENRKQSIFLPYEQVEKGDARELGGTGLGLPICKAIIEEHKGKIWVESNQGSPGSTFYFTVAAYDSNNETEAQGSQMEMNFGPHSGS